MSLGWQTESALLPGKVRPIKVGDKSLLSLKALVYEKEQQQKLSKADSNDLAYAKKPHASKHSEGGKGLNKSNRRMKNDESEVELRAQAALAAKAKLYEDIEAGKVTTSSSLVDFKAKKRRAEEPTAKNRAESPAAPSRTAQAEPAAPGGPWQWSTGHADPKEEGQEGSASAWQAAARDERALQAEASSRMREAAEGGRVVSQWERTLLSSSRPYLEDVHQTTLLQRAQHSAENSMKTAREEKLELLKRRKLSTS